MSKSVSENRGEEEDDESQLGEEEDQLAKFGFKQPVTLDMTLPDGEKEVIEEYMMQFIDRNAASRAAEGQSPEEEKRPQDLQEASPDYECNLSEVINFLKKCGYPLENCFISFFSPIFSGFINCGLDPLPPSIKISGEDLCLTTS